MAKGYIGNASSKAYPLSKGWVGNGSNKAYPLKAGWMGDANGKARKVFGAAGYIWQKYAVTTTQEYQEVAGESTTVRYNNRFCVGSSYSFDADTGQFTVRQLTMIDDSSTGASNAIGKYYIELSFDSGTYSGTTLYLITNASYNPFTKMNLTVTPYTAELTTIQAKGDLLGTVTAEDITTYPLNGVADDGYWYVLQNEIAQIEIVYSGTYVDELVSMQAGDYRLLTLTGSGTLTLPQAVTADIWICGGGAGGGGKASTMKDCWGGGGGYIYKSNNIQIKNLQITIGSSDGDSVLTGDITGTAQSGGLRNPNGSSGGGGGEGDTSGGIGVGDTTIPFEDNTVFTPYCDGGGGGTYTSEEEKRRYSGGNGGTNGSSGSSCVEESYSGSTPLEAGTGGGLYGGDGGRETDGKGSKTATAATGYGSGGGGGTAFYGENRSTYKEGGDGYQGVCFIRIPLN